MGNFKAHNRKGSYNAARGDREGFSGRSNGGFGGRSSGFGGNRGRSFGGERRSFGDNDRPKEMHDVTCGKCGKECRVPFKPTGNRPVLCSDCFRQSGQGEERNSFSSRSSSSSQSGITAEQFKQLNEKLDKILEMLESLEVEVMDEDEDDSEEDLEEEN